MHITLPISTVILSFILSLFSSAHAAFDTFNTFQLGFEVGLYDNQTLPGNCGVGGRSGSLCGIGNGFETRDPDTTPFYQGDIMINGVMYWHIIVGDPSSGFAMESYTAVASGSGFGSFSGGLPANFGTLRLEEISGNGWDPLGIDPARGVDFTGNGSGDPTRSIIRQVMGDGVWDPQTKTWNCDSAEFCSEFLKDRLNFKPIISQTINDATTGALMQAQFQLDMSNITYSNMTTKGVITNTITFTGDPILDNGNFDMATDSQRSDVTGGRYIYNDCANPSFLYGGSCWQAFSVSGGRNDYQEGSYTYSDGNSTDPMAYDWGGFWDPLQNDYPAPGNETKCNSGTAPNSCSGNFVGVPDDFFGVPGDFFVGVPIPSVEIPDPFAGIPDPFSGVPIPSVDVSIPSISVSTTPIL